MSRIFISHASANNAQALAIREWLKENGWDECFLDISVKEGISAGQWKEALKKAGDRCKAVLCLLSPAWRESKECQVEYRMAQSSGKKIVGLIVEPMPPESIPTDFRENQYWDLTAELESRRIFRVENDKVPLTKVSFSTISLERLKNGLLKAGLDPAYFDWPPPNDPRRSPYPGLRPLEENDAGVCFGRDSQLAKAHKILNGIHERGTPHMFVLRGASGTGKSSFLRAGLWPRLRRNADRLFYLPRVIRPERAAISGPTGLVGALEDAFQDNGIARTRASIRRDLGQGKDGLVSLIERLQEAAYQKLCDRDASWPTVLLTVDQAEQLYGQTGQPEADDFIELVRELLKLEHTDAYRGTKTTRPVLATLAIRTDSYYHLDGDSRLADIHQEVFDLPSLRREDYRVIIEEPAKRASMAGRPLDIEPELTEQLLQDVAGTDALPLLAYTLERLFLEQGTDGNLTADEYVELGGFGASIEAAIRKTCEEPDHAPAIPTETEERKKLLRNTFIPWFVTSDPETGVFKGRVLPDRETPDEIRPMIERLVQTRLVVRDIGTKPLDGKPNVVHRLATDAIIHKWQTLHEWCAADHDAIKIADDVLKAAKEWADHGRQRDWLQHTGARLEATREILTRSMFAQFLGTLGGEYLEACTHPGYLKAQKPDSQSKVGTGSHRAKQWLKNTGYGMLVLAVLYAIGALAGPDRHAAKSGEVPSSTPVTSEDDLKPLPDSEFIVEGKIKPRDQEEAGEKTDQVMAMFINGSCVARDLFVDGHRVITSLNWAETKEFLLEKGDHTVKACVSGTGVCAEFKQGYSVKWIVGDMSGCWKPKPLVPGIWVQVGNNERHRLAEKFSRGAGNKYRYLASQLHTAPMRKLALDFYAGAELIEAQISQPGGSPGILSFVDGIADVIVMGNTNATIYDGLNSRYRIDLSTPEKAKGYLMLFFAVAEGKHGSFRPIQDNEDILWRADADADIKNRAQELIAPISVVRDDKGNWIVQLVLEFKGSLFKAGWRIAKNGEMEREGNEEVILEDLPVKNIYYKDGVRYIE